MIPSTPIDAFFPPVPRVCGTNSGPPPLAKARFFRYLKKISCFIVAYTISELINTFVDLETNMTQFNVLDNRMPKHHTGLSSRTEHRPQNPEAGNDNCR